MNRIAAVVINGTTREFDKEYHYEIPDDLAGKIQPGMRVLVPFGRADRLREAYVLELVGHSELNGLKDVKSVVDDTAVLKPGLLKLAPWMKDRYICTSSDAIKVMLPPGISVTGQRRVSEKTIRAAFLAISPEEVIEEIENNRIKRIQQIRILELLLENEYISVSDLLRFTGVSASVLNTLKKYGYIDFKDIEVQRDPVAHREILPTAPLLPTPQQARALEKIQSLLDRREFEEVLLHGVTGSGKTEVYLQLIQHCFDMGRNAIVLVPEISLTPQMIERFKSRFGDYVAVLHSRLSMGERYDQWRLIRDGKIKVAVGARSAVFAPFENLGLVIIDEEHEGTYKSEITPKYHARDVARERCKNEKSILLLGSATPSVETYYRAKAGEIVLLEMAERANHMVMPGVGLVDMRKELDEGNRSVFSRKLVEEIRENIRLKQQTILFMNRRGYASFVLCRDCGLTLKCPNCNVSLTYHAHDERLICHYCGFTTKNPTTCPKCKGNHIRHFGTGTQRIEDEIKKQFPESTVLRMDMDTTSYKNSHEEILKQFREEKADILVGTQMIAKGHDFPNVTLVGVLAADSLLNFNDYRACERTFQLVTQVAGRAGRGEIPGRVLIQSYNVEDFSILAACSHDYKGFYRQEIKIREKLRFPPFSIIGALVLSSVNDRQAFIKAREVKDQLEREFGSLAVPAEILGPVRAPLSKIKNKYRWRLIVKCGAMDPMVRAFGRTSDEYYRKKGKSGVELSLDINPVNML